MTEKFSQVYPYTRRESLMEGPFNKRLSFQHYLQQRFQISNTAAFFTSFIIQLVCTVGLLTIAFLLVLQFGNISFNSITSRTQVPTTKLVRLAQWILFVDVAFGFVLSVLLLLTMGHFIAEAMHRESNDQTVMFFARIKPYLASAIGWVLVVFAYKVIFEASLEGYRNLQPSAPVTPEGKKIEEHVTNSIQKIMHYFKTITFYDVAMMALSAWAIARWLVLFQKAFLFHIAFGFNKSSTKERADAIKEPFKVVEQLRQAYTPQRVTLEDFKYDHVAYYEALMKNSDEIGEQIFASIKSTAEAHDAVELSREHFQSILSPTGIDALFSFIDSNNSNQLALVEFKRGIYFVYQERVNIERTLRDNEDIIGRLDELMILLTRCMMVFSTCIAFQFGIFYSGVVGLGSATFSFLAIKDISRDISKSIIFLFAYHPFDINDRIVVDGETYTVKKIGFLVTTVKGPKNATVYMKNSSLCDKVIRNLRRSGDQSESVTVVLEGTTSQEMLNRLEGEVNKFLLENTRDYYPKCSVSPLLVNSIEKLTYTFSYTHRSNFQNGSLRQERCKRFNFALFDAINQLGINMAKPD